MCGIAGFFNSRRASASVPMDATDLRRMATAISHRGPDAEGVWADDYVGLAHRRLSIIDLSNGAQPMGNEDGSVQVVFNGEIYNFESLRNRLLARGHQFRTRSDTEVLVHLYEDMGERLVDELRGMFAFAIWDARQRRLLLARDRIGLKPLYYSHDGDRLLFGSEIKAILAAPAVSRDIDHRAVEEYLTFGFVPGSRSIFRSIRKLPPAHWLSITEDALRQELVPRRYWRLQTEVEEGLGEEEWIDRIRDKFRETVAMHRISDVPIGAFLSGGIDSGAMVAELQRSGTDTLQTFSIGFHDEQFSELPFAREVARQFGTTHVEQIVTPEASSSLEELVHYYDEPFADTSAVPTLAVSRLAQEHVKVVLSGDGGDEAFGGYSRYRHDIKEAAVRQWIPKAVRGTILRQLANLWPKADWLPRPMRWKTTLTNLSLEPAQAYANSMTITRHDLRRRILASGFLGRESGMSPEALIAAHYPTKGLKPLEAMTYTDIETILPDDFLTKVDRASMAVGLEVRPPLVDHEFLELSARIPGQWKVRDGQSKWIFKQMLRGTLPGTILDRRKQGFEIPVDAWLRTDLRDQFQSTVLNRNHRIGHLIDQVYVEKLYRSHLSGGGRHGSTLWALLVLGTWIDKYQPQGV
ncbi:asparagine synthase (glutamine-hydrolyzing) [Planctomycetaceae bacterium SH139]